MIAMMTMIMCMVLILAALSILAIRRGLKVFGITGLVVATLMLGVIAVRFEKEGRIALRKPRLFGQNGVCLVCNGTGQVDCRNCENGKPLYPKWLCPQCKGRIVYTCPECHGLGRYICEVCNGTGVAYYGGLCLRCNGGKVTCQKCDGQGKLDCFYCARRERICAYCNGKGTLTCSNCEGRGKEVRLIKRVVRQDGWVEEIYDEGRKGYTKRTYDNNGNLRRIDYYNEKGNWTGSLSMYEGYGGIEIEYRIPLGGQ